MNQWKKDETYFTRSGCYYNPIDDKFPGSLPRLLSEGDGLLKFLVLEIFGGRIRRRVWLLRGASRRDLRSKSHFFSEVIGLPVAILFIRTLRARCIRVGPAEREATLRDPSSSRLDGIHQIGTQ